LTATTADWVMRADICEPTDTAALACFKRALQVLGAELVGDYGSSFDVQLLEVRIGDEFLQVFADSWSVDIEGPPQLVERIVAEIKNQSP
jgi:hypothetical protein